MPLSHGGRYYRAHPERERARKAGERAALASREASTAVALVRHNSNLRDRWKLKFDRVWMFEDSASRRDFRKFLREHNWAVVPNWYRHEKARDTSFELRNQRLNLLVEGLGYDPAHVEEMADRGRVRSPSHKYRGAPLPPSRPGVL